MLMIIKDTITFVNNMAALPQSDDPHLEQQGISTTMPNRQQLHIRNIYILSRSSCSAGHNASIAHLLCNNEMSLIVGAINARHSRLEANTNEDERGEQLADEIDAADYIILGENEATRQPTNGRSNSPDISLASNNIALLSVWSVSTSLAIDQLPILITISSELSKIDGPRRTYINFKNRTGRAMLKPATNTWLKLAKQELSDKRRRPSGKKLIRPVTSSFRPHSTLPTYPAGISQIARR